MTLRGLIGIGIISLIVMLAGGLAWQTGQAGKFRALDKAHRACVAAIGPKARPDARPETLCDPAVAGHWAVSARAVACDQALSARPENTYGVRASCSTPVKTLQASRDAARHDLQGALDDLKAERAGRAAAIARAAATATATAQRKARRESLDQTAPRDPDGRQHCDAQCLRDRTR
ncbi:MAG: hypothetical protein GC145_18660 [Caulobacter sp.]|nr:hypothetical protein [Caulobacter sp.]